MSKMPMSAELEAMLEASKAARKSSKVEFSNRFGDQSHTKRQAKLAAIANRKLRKSGCFQPKAEVGELPAECCGTHGLRPTWHGRAS
jgi:hypothetical protein